MLEKQIKNLPEPWRKLRYYHYRQPVELLEFVLLTAELDVPEHRSVRASGCARDPAEAVMKLCGELAERLALVCFMPLVQAKGSEADLRDAGFRVFSVGEYLGQPLEGPAWPFIRYDADLVLDWVLSTDLATGGQVLIPAALTFPGQSRSGPVLCELTTNGTAAGKDYNQALQHALDELLERDTLRHMWFTGGLLTPSEPPHFWHSMSERDAALGWRTTFHTVPQLNRPPLVVVLTESSTRPLLGIGSSMDTDLDGAAEHALAEALQIRFLASVSQMMPVAEVNDFLDHVRYYAHPDGCRFVRDALLGSGNAAAPVEDSLDTGPEALTDAVVLRLRNDDRVQVVRVLAPHAQAMEARHDAARLMGRTREFARRTPIRQEPSPFA
ncbi:YcaO-like family protein [Parafrankia elaeagni]|uniref:YcaO-like family protein n=1 Tax=Parafrankia elaeagni TaxID=222534 RepID=UPI000399EE14|nr:YcaO-like family protein [Parafrankia elaeagni]